jgi:hypothetical protein
MRKSGPERAPQVKTSLWYDLVYHALAHLPVAAADASSIFDERYVRWSEEQFAACGAGATVPRTLLLDAARMAALYDASEQAFLLHAWPLLWDDRDGFLRDMGTDFAKLTWPDPSRDRLARAIIAGTHPALPDLLRTALWSELRNGFEAVWRKAVAPWAYRGRFARDLASLGDRLPGLREVAWSLSLPLRVHGRLLEPQTGRPMIVVGVADAELGVDESHPVIQGCHEYLVWRVQRVVSAAQPWSTVSGRPGHEAFRSVEDAALTLGARVFRGSEWEGPYEAWLSRLFPDAAPAETAAELAAGTRLSPEMAAAADGLEL